MPNTIEHASKALQRTAGPLDTAHRGIHEMGQLVLACAVVLIISAGLLVFTAFQVVGALDRADLDSERRRAANAIDILVARSGPLVAADADWIGDLTGLRDAHISSEPATGPHQEHIPLVGGQGESGSFLVWTRNPIAEQISLRFAPVRLPIIIVMLSTVMFLLLRMRAVVADIDQQRRLERQKSRSDVMTGLANRLAFDTALAGAVTGTNLFALVLLDLDGFKRVNDGWGHAAGDHVLQVISERLAKLIGPDDMLARIGGDEFAMLIGGRADRISMSDLAQRCIAAVEPPIQLVHSRVRVGVSLGIVISLPNQGTPEQLLAAADAALYRAKSIRGSSLCFGAPEIADAGRTGLEEPIHI